MKIIYLLSILTLIPFVILKIEGEKFNSTELEKYRKTILDNHNYYRKKHQVGQLTRNSDLEKIAQSHAEKLMQGQSYQDTENVYKKEKIGENRFSCSNNIQVCINATYTTDNWYKESATYNYDDPHSGPCPNRFTQMVWKETKQIGCGASCLGYRCYGICHYYPAGNNYTQYIYNVLPIKEEEKSMSFAGKFFLSLFIIFLIVVGVFSIYHFVYRKRKFNQLKDYFKLK